ncbi:galactose-binding like protein [Aulographum hederae CBS 113979]|uniref:Galactose-binding like protein n=1 Tax=Aulographum hederae CBS 113979 TaxID=1176131 RepID=A0A6G1H0A3_9PEZI|nr:galactose-binding like protein [Aulographum hederae CBS 113979]
MVRQPNTTRQTRRSTRPVAPPPPPVRHFEDPPSEPEEEQVDEEEDEATQELEGAEGEAEGECEGEGEGEEAEENDVDGANNPPPHPTPPPLSSHLRDISALASWTVSTCKPNCGVPQLLNPSTEHYWQSDGPQPHHLNIHFFKMVEIAGMRLFLDNEQDESYTPTRIGFLAGTGEGDLMEWGEMTFESPSGWIDVDFTGVRKAGLNPLDSETSASESEDEGNGSDDSDARKNKKLPLLRCMLVQVQIRENLQNGKDTHLRGVQIYARDKSAAAAGRVGRRVEVRMTRRREGKAGLGGDEDGGGPGGNSRVRGAFRKVEEPDWLENLPEIR